MWIYIHEKDIIKVDLNFGLGSAIVVRQNKIWINVDSIYIHTNRFEVGCYVPSNNDKFPFDLTQNKVHFIHTMTFSLF